MLENFFLSEKSTIYSGVEGEDVVNLLDPTFVIPDANIDGNAVVTSSDFIARPDLLGLQLYDRQEYGNLICKINGIANPFELNEDQYLFVPAPQEISSFVNTNWDEDELVVDETIYDETENVHNSNTPSPKTKKEKRAPNEAVVGDERFKINYSKRIVVY